MWKPTHNRVLIRPDGDYDKVSGIWIDYADNNEAARHIPCTGTVIAVPEKLIYNGGEIKELKEQYLKQVPADIQSKIQELVMDSVQFDTDMELQAGDKVVYHYRMLAECEEEGTDVDIDGVTHFLIPYDMIYAAKRGEELIPVNGYVLIEPEPYKDFELKLSVGENGVLYKVPTKNEKPATGIVRYVGKTVNSYLMYPHLSEIDEVKAGDRVLFNRAQKVPLEYEYHRRMSKEKLVRMQRKDILAIEKL